MNKLRVGICGWGNVATGLFKTLQTNSVEIKKRSNLEIEIIAIDGEHLASSLFLFPLAALTIGPSWICLRSLKTNPMSLPSFP